MKRAIYLEQHEIETVVLSLESHASEAHSRDTVAVVTGKRELRRITERFRALLPVKDKP
jgi:hypothetical protein